MILLVLLLPVRTYVRISGTSTISGRSSLQFRGPACRSEMVHPQRSPDEIGHECFRSKSVRFFQVQKCYLYCRRNEETEQNCHFFYFINIRYETGTDGDDILYSLGPFFGTFVYVTEKCVYWYFEMFIIIYFFPV